MAQDKKLQANIDNSNPAAYPDAQIKDNDGSDNGTPVARVTMSDMFEFFAKAMRLAGLTFNNQYDNETNGYQYIEAVKALAGKNDFVYTINTATITPTTGSPFNAVTIDTDIAILQLNEVLIGKAAADYNSEIKIVKAGTGTPVKSIASSDAYKTGDYLMLINTASGIAILQMATAGNLSPMGIAAGFLKAASDAQELTGTAVNVATTPASNLSAFSERVNDNDPASPFLASATQNGLLSKEQWAQIANFTSPVKNTGWFSANDPGGAVPGSSLARSGDVTVATVDSNTATTPKGSTYSITVAHPMTGTSYFVRMMVESQGAITSDRTINCPVFKPVSPTNFLVSISESLNIAQNIKVHVEVVQI